MIDTPEPKPTPIDLQLGKAWLGGRGAGKTRVVEEYLASLPPDVVVIHVYPPK